MTKRDAFWCVIGVVVAVWIGLPIVEREVQWQNRTLACVPNYGP